MSPFRLDVYLMYKSGRAAATTTCRWASQLSSWKSSREAVDGCWSNADLAPHWDFRRRVPHFRIGLKTKSNSSCRDTFTGRTRFDLLWAKFQVSKTLHYVSLAVPPSFSLFVCSAHRDVKASPLRAREQIKQRTQNVKVVV